MPVSFLACSRDGTAKLWNCGRGECDYTLIDCGSVINACALGFQNSTGSKDQMQLDGEIFEFTNLCPLGYIIDFQIVLLQTFL